ncbi:hypothetical protein GCM10028777_30830 [Angustibacter speluncae]
MSERNGAYADVNGISLYHEVHGEGVPLVLLHGGLMSGEGFDHLLPALTERHQVVLVDLQGHGRTADVDRPLSTQTMADDVAALVEHLGLGQVDVVGYSLGGGVALQVAVRHPQVVRRLVMCSVNLTHDAIDPAIREQQGQVNAAAAEFMKQTRCTSCTSGSTRGPRTSPVCSTRSARSWPSRSTRPRTSAGSRCPPW